MAAEDKVYCPFNPPTYDCPGGCPSMQDRACINGDENRMTPTKLTLGARVQALFAIDQTSPEDDVK
jgi:hypothetical protein